MNEEDIIKLSLTRKELRIICDAMEMGLDPLFSSKEEWDLYNKLKGLAQ